MYIFFNYINLKIIFFALKSAVYKYYNFSKEENLFMILYCYLNIPNTVTLIPNTVTYMLLDLLTHFKGI